MTDWIDCRMGRGGPGDAVEGEGMVTNSRRQPRRAKAVPLPVITNCDSCGACCTGQAALPIHMASTAHFPIDPVNPLPPKLDAELVETAERFTRDGFPPDGSACIWYDAEAKCCKHYEHRPTICRDEVKPGDEACRKWRRQTGVDPQQKWTIRGGKVVVVPVEREVIAIPAHNP
jgi:uncharacterized protein